MDIRKLQRVIVDGLEDVKAQDIAVFNTEHLSPLFERVVIASGSSNRQTKALASSVRVAVKAAGFQVMRTEGEENGEWIIVDCGAAVVHIMQPAIRQYYQLEEIWGDKPVALKAKATRSGLVKASEPMEEADEAPVKPKKASGKTTSARKAATTKPEPAKKPAAKKVAAKKAAPAPKAAPKAASKPVAKKAATKVAAKKVVAKKVAAKKVATKLVVNAPTAKKPAAKAPARKVVARKVAGTKAPAIKKVAAKKVAAKKAPARKTAR
ncbi:ribosome silencing factor [Aquabacterium parvum]|jgi:ribosome-associated protein|uniref:ribosome silencing factor n=1 Tax=Aquabacterium parvum TaxID=70584 RepID=UPI00071903F5|nr:ribosome silencing factor [Aquabacterium parvum]MBU0914978.1 ribosome silencing factor [Gammaproteobacteria bacterium]